MKLTKKLEAEILTIYSSYWNAYLKGDMKTFASCLDESIIVYGTAVGEIFVNKKEAVKFYTNTADQMTGKAEFRNRTFKLKAIGETIVIFEKSDLYVLMDGVWTFYDNARITGIFQKKGNKWKLVHQHGSFPDSRTDDGDQISTDKIKQENIRLKEAIKRRTYELENKNRELEIETALEKVRSSALAMNKPSDMVNVCNVISDQLQVLGVKDIRNVQTAIINEQKSTYLNYQYFAAYKEGVIEETDYRKHPTSLAMVEEMKKSTNSTFNGSMKGEEFTTFREWRKQNNQFPDPILDKVDSAHYYFYSIGQGGLGLSTYRPLYDDGLEIFKRFHNVFTLAYRRFVDIEKAIAQAREAKIETALEKVRARTMAMQRSDELSETAAVLFHEIKNISEEELIQLTIGIYNEAAGLIEFRVTSWAGGGEQENRAFNLSIEEPTVIKPAFTAWKQQKKSIVIDLVGKKLEGWLKYRNANTGVTVRSADTKGRRVITIAFFSKGHISLSSPLPISAETIQLLERFAVVFDGTYTRFLDLKNAEAQAREAEIELALERVRARTMAMQHSEELADASFLLDSQVRALGIKTRGCAFNIYGKNESTEWFSSEAGTMPTYKTPRENIFLRYYEAGLKGATIHIEEFEGKACAAHYKYLCTIPVMGDALQQMKKNGGSFPTKQTDHVVYFKYGYLLFITFEPVPDAHDIFLRFTKVFEQTYTRFLDLQKAEAQAREAEIQLALERVRAKSLAMQQTSELQEVVNEVAQQLQQMKIDMDGGVIIIINDEVDKDVPLWGAAGAAHYVQKATVPYLDISIISRMKSAIKKRESFLIERYTKEEKDEFMQHLFRHHPWDKLAQERKQELLAREGGYCRSMSISRHTSIAIINHHGRAFSEADNNILKRFGNVLEQSYTRFLDLKNAEAQAREAQIEAALERVRSRSMAMYNSSDLSAVVFEMFTQLIKLDAQLDRCIIMIVDPQTFGINWYLSGKEGLLSNNGFLIQNNSHPSHRAYLDGWHTKRKKWNYHLAGDEKKEWDAFGFTQTELAQLPDFIKADMSAVESIHLTISSDDFGNLIASSLYPLSEIHADIVERFTKVFNQTYTRFLDLQKAEAQNKIIQAENERKTRELEEARELQLAMLPKEIPKLKDFEIAVYMKTATEVGGDYYDYHVHPDGTLTVILGDATGHGMMSGMMVSVMKSLFMAGRSDMDLKQFFENSNKSIKDMQVGRLMMALMGVQISSEKVIASNAGMPSLFYFRNKSQKAGEFVLNNMPLGAMHGIKYSLKEIKHEKGDTLLLMSDGFAELKNENNEMFGYQRALKEFKKVAIKNPNEIIEHLKEEGKLWTKGKDLEDDVTFVVIKLR